MTVTLYCGDCLEVMKNLPDGSIDAVVTDPPYGQSNESYDAGVYAGIWRECWRLAKDNAAMLSFTGNPTYHRIATDIEAAGWAVRQMWAWVYRDGFMTSAWPKEGFDRLAPAFDPICYATKGKVLLTVDREGAGRWTRQRDDGSRNGYSGRSGGHGSPKAMGHYPRSIVATDGAGGFQYFVLSRTSPAIDRDEYRHPNRKPLALMDWLIGKLPEGATILDPFMGSGTTGVACAQSGRNFIGIELDPTYYAIAQKRIAEAQQQPTLFAAEGAAQ
jgi:site-specific DNA-methyltransferase (adenine-specific)